MYILSMILLSDPFFDKFVLAVQTELGYWHQRADERHDNPPQGNQELLVVRHKAGRPPGELGVSKSMECDLSSLQCFDTVGCAT